MEIHYKPDEYIKKIKSLSEQYLLILNEITKNYPKAKAFTEDIKTNENFNDTTSILNRIQGDFFVLQDKLNQDTRKISISIKETNKTIEDLNKENKRIKKELSSLISIKNGSKQMANDTRYTYQRQFVENSLLLIGIISVAYKLLYKINTK